MNPQRIVIVGGGAAGFFAALACAEAQSGAEIVVLEKTSQFLSKVKISGGGRCNVTHADFDAREFSKSFPRGERALISAFGKFQASDTVAWYENRGVKNVVKKSGGGFELLLSNSEKLTCDKLLLAIGGCRTPALGQLAVSLGHTLETPVPSLFTFHIATPWLRELSGVSVEN